MSGMGRGLSRDVMTRRTRGHRTHDSQLTRWHYQSPAAAALHHSSARVSLTDENLRTCSSSTLNSSCMYSSKTNPRVYGMKAFTSYSKQYYSISLWAYLLSEYQLLHISIPGIEAISTSLHLAYHFFVTHFLMPNLIKVVITDRFTRI